MTFEQARAELEEIVRRLEDGQPSLDIHHMDYARFAEGRVGKPKSVV